MTQGKGSASRIYIQAVDGGAARAVTPEGFAARCCHAVSPDGKSFIALRIADRNWVIFPISGGQPRAVPGIVANDLPIQWVSDGYSIFVFQSDEAPSGKIFRIDLANGQRTLVKAWALADPAGVLRLVTTVAITPDGKTIVYTFVRTLSNLQLLRFAH